MKLHFEPIDVLRRFDLAARFRLETHRLSFGETEGFWDAVGGPKGYAEFLRNRTALHAFLGNRVVGQLEMGLDRRTDDGGYVHLYYLITELRGSGLAQDLVEHSALHFRRLGCRRIRLSVSPENGRAVRFYGKVGFVDLGPREDSPRVRLMELSI